MMNHAPTMRSVGVGAVRERSELFGFRPGGRQEWRPYKEMVLVGTRFCASANRQIKGLWRNTWFTTWWAWRAMPLRKSSWLFEVNPSRADRAAGPDVRRRGHSWRRLL